MEFVIFDKLKNLLSPIGNGIALAFSKIFKFVFSLGLNLTITQVKIISLIILLALFYVVLNFLNIGKKIVKYSILVLIAILILSIIFSF